LTNFCPVYDLFIGKIFKEEEGFLAAKRRGGRPNQGFDVTIFFWDNLCTNPTLTDTKKMSIRTRFSTSKKESFMNTSANEL
jgi:hypothetical protein